MAEPPEHRTDKAVALMDRLGYRRKLPDRITTFDEAVYPDDDQLFVGAYDTGFLLCSWPLVSQVVELRNAKLMTILREAGDGWLLAIALHSVVDLFGYAYYEAGHLVRSRSGSANDGIFVDFGSPLPEEQALLDTAEERDGKRVFRLDLDTDESEYIDVDAYGEQFTMEVSRKSLGCSA